jgi:flagellar hook-associated protein 3 FlgL
MAITRVSDAQSFAFFVARANKLEVSARRLQEQLASGRRLIDPEDDPLGAGRASRLDSSIAALDEYKASSRFGLDVLAAQDKALGDAEQIMVRAEEIATQMATGLVSADERLAAAEEVRGLLEGLTQVGNTEIAGRRVFGGLALDAPPPFADPDTGGYTAATAFTGSTFEPEVKIGSGTGERVRIATRGDTTFTGALQALQDLEAAITTNTNIPGQLTGLAAARGVLARERASVGAREAELIGRGGVIDSVKVREQGDRAEIVDADLVTVITDLTQTQSALQALFTAQSELSRTSLVNLLRI